MIYIKYIKYVADMGFDEEDGEFEDFDTQLEETGKTVGTEEEEVSKKKKKKKK